MEDWKSLINLSTVTYFSNEITINFLTQCYLFLALYYFFHVLY